MAWTCPACGCVIDEEGFDTCWRCGRPNKAIAAQPLPEKPSLSPATAPTASPNTLSIPGLEGLSAETLQREINRGGCFFAFPQVTGLVIITWRKEVSLCFLKAGQPKPPGRAGAILHSLFFGWWSLRGPLWTIAAIITNVMGGENVTRNTIAEINSRTGWNLTMRSRSFSEAWSAFIPHLVAMIICCGLAWLGIVLFVFPHVGSSNGMTIGYVVTALCVIGLYFVSPLNRRS